MSNFKPITFKVITQVDNQELEVSLNTLEEYEKYLNKLNEKKTQPGISPEDLKKVNKEIDDLEKNFKKAGNGVKLVDKELEVTAKNLRLLQKEQKTFAVGSDDYRKAADKIADFKDQLEGAKRTQISFSEQLEAAPGPLGRFFSGLDKVKNSFTTLGGAIKASGIGLLVTIIGGITAAFAGNEKAMKKLEPLFINLQRITGGLYRVFEPLLDSFLEMAEVALPYITEGIGVFYSALVGVFTYIKEAGTGLAKIYQGIFTLDVDKIKEGTEQIKNSFSTAVKAGTDAYKRFETGSKEQTKTEKEQQEEREKLKEEEDKKRQEREQKEKDRREKKKQEEQQELIRQKQGIETAIELEKKKANTNEETLRKLLEKKDELENNEILKEKERLEKKKKLTKEEKQRLLDINNLLKLQQENREDAIKQELSSDKKSAEDLKKQREQTYKELIDKLNKYLDEERKTIETKRSQNQKKDQLTLRQQLLDGLITQDDFNKKSLELNLKYAQQKQEDDKKSYEKGQAGLIFSLLTRQIDQKTFNDQFQQNQQEFNNQNINNEAAVTEASQAIQGMDVETKKAASQQLLQLKQAETEAIIQLQMTQVEAVQQVGEILTSLLGDSKEAAIAGLLIEKGSNIAKIIIGLNANILAAQTQANLIPPLLPPGIPNPAYPIAQGLAVKNITRAKISAGIGIGATIAATIQGIGQINEAFNKKKEEKKERGGLLRGPLHQQGGIMTPFGELEGGEYVINRASTMMFRPTLDRINSLGGGQVDLTQSILNGNVNQPTQQPIIKTYVVASEMSSQQELNRVIRDRSKI